MSKSEQRISPDPAILDLLAALSGSDLDYYRGQLQKLASLHQVEVMDYAAAMLCLLQRGQSGGVPGLSGLNSKSKESPGAMKMVRYRMEVGSRHKVSVDELKKVLIEESGVDNKRIGPVEMHADHCVVSLPSGMPGDIFFHLKTVAINQQALNISRVDGKNRRIGRKAGQRKGRRKFGNSSMKKNRVGNKQS